MQGFKWRNNEFIVEEFAMIQLDNKDDHRTRILFKPACKWDDLPRQYKATNSWVIHNYHGIQWDDDDIPYNKLNMEDLPVKVNVNESSITDINSLQYCVFIVAELKILNIDNHILQYYSLDICYDYISPYQHQDNPLDF
ncbi:hypothetical protein PV326_011947 [Microctonus aethiopoides]|nr:hypothetical protein PV326_011947 [Microctonus aethiopoides]